MSNHSYLDLVNRADNFHLPHSTEAHNASETLLPFRLSTSATLPIGLLRPSVVLELQKDNEWRRSNGLLEIWDIHTAYISFVPSLNTPAARTRAMKDTTTRWRDSGIFADVIGISKWRSEWYDVCQTPFGPMRIGGGDPESDESEEGKEENYAFSMERSACALFGLVTYGVHMSVYEEDDNGIRMWVPRRAKTKPTWPGYLDNSVAGGIPGGSSPYESIVKESMEEASLPADLVQRYIKAAGCISYFYQTDKGWLQPEVEYVYDMCIPKGEIDLRPMDGEVESFELISNLWAGEQLLPLDDVIARMRAGKFKPNCAIGNDLANGNATTLTAVAITPTRTVLTMIAGSMEFNMTFLSPIEPNDFVRQSIPFSYIYVEATSRDGHSHSVQVYSDITAEWLSGVRDDVAQWSTQVGTDNVYHAFSLQSQSQFVETNQQAEWGTVYYGTTQHYSATYKTNAAATCRTQFKTNGRLDDGEDTNFRAINNAFPVFAFSQDLGTIQSTAEPVVWIIGYSRDPAIRYIDLSGAAQDRSLYFQSTYPNIDGVSRAQINEFLLDFSDAQQRAETLDARILSAATAISSDYGDLVSIAARQAYGATELTIAKGSDGNYNKSDVMMFMKNVGGITPQRVNPVEVLYQAFPIFMYIDPTLGAPLLEPLLRFQNSSSYVNPYAAQDVARDIAFYPTETANMIIMATAHARATGNASLVNRYYPLFKKWADFLNSSTLYPSSEISADLETSSNQTNLAIKGIIAIQAMSQLSSGLGQSSDAEHYSSIASEYANRWQSMALNTGGQPYMLLSYGDTSSFTFGYNLFADRWLKTNIVNSTVYNAQTNLIKANLGQTQFGLPIDSSKTLSGDVVSSWNLFQAAIATDSSVRNSLISMVRARASFNSTVGAFPTVYDPNSGAINFGVASPAQGSMFALLALNATVFSISNGSQSSGSSSNSSSRIAAGVIAGSVVGGIALLTALVLGVLYCLRRRRRGAREHDRVSIDGSSFVDVAPVVTPFEMAETGFGNPSGHSGVPEHRGSMGYDTLIGPSYMHELDLASAFVPPSANLSSPHAPTALAYAASTSALSESLSTGSSSSASASGTAARKRGEALGLHAVGPLSPTGKTERVFSYTREDSSTSRDGLVRASEDELRNQVEDLRREMERIRMERAEVELPPRYAA
ncbi:hypothetical protein EW146_g8851 [Bondarzewia mesenterica]|uniref:Nudix hydrolase domain-containing protein n=1 Tax=Bondarzewia mesenterica TaxID=1095465 RepID=A0A4V3XD98_9AGAM|nr:hypothetical protein EW146_g8851 [Bondarzewia mesenterica]